MDERRFEVRYSCKAPSGKPTVIGGKLTKKKKKKKQAGWLGQRPRGTLKKKKHMTQGGKQAAYRGRTIQLAQDHLFFFATVCKVKAWPPPPFPTLACQFYC